MSVNGRGNGDNKKKVLVTGASGFLGSRLVGAMLPHGEVEVFAGFHKTALSSAIPANCHVRIDCSDTSSIKDTLRGLAPDIIVHLAAITSPGYCEKNSDLSYKVNDVSALADAISEVAPNTLVIFASTDLVYRGEATLGNLNLHPVGDESLVDPRNVYAKTKYTGEQRVLKLKHGIVLRFSNMIGPGAGKFYDFLRGSIDARKVIGLRADEIRSFVYVEDVVHLIKSIIMRSGTPDFPAGTFNVGGPEGLSRLALAQSLAQALGVRMRIMDSREDAERVYSEKEDDWVVYTESNRQAVQASGIFNPRDVSMESSVTENAFDVKFQSMQSIFKDIE